MAGKYLPTSNILLVGILFDFIGLFGLVWFVLLWFRVEGPNGI